VTETAAGVRRARALAKLLLFAALLAAGAYAVRVSPLGRLVSLEGAGRLAAALREPWWAPPAFVAAYAVATAFDFSGLVLTLVGGAVFGFWWGTLLNLAGANLGAWAAFWVARRLGRDGIAALLGRRAAGLDRLAAQAGFVWLLRLRLIPLVPFNLLNFAAGLTNLPWRTYAGATALGIVPGTAIYTFFADALLGGSREAGHRAFVRLLVAGALLVMLSFVPGLARRLGRGAGDRERRERPGPNSDPAGRP